MTVIRVEKEVVLIRRTLIEDGRLSWEARGLMVYIDAQPDDFDVDMFCAHCMTSAVLDELLQFGYLKDDGKA